MNELHNDKQDTMKRKGGVVMPTTPVYDMRGESAGQIELRPDVWDAPVNEPLIHQAVVSYLSNQRTGTASTKGRAEKRGGGRKPWPQKGLGRARHGSIRSPLWRGGGVTFGPKPRSFRKSMNKKAKRAAMRSALSARQREDAVRVIDEIDLPQPKTKMIVQMLRELDLMEGKVLIVTEGMDDALYKSSRNIPGVDVMRGQDLNIYEVLDHDYLLFVGDATSVVEEVLAGA